MALDPRTRMGWPNVVLLIVAAMPLGLAVKIFELRFKMAAMERQAVLRELPKDTKIGFAAYSALAILVIGDAAVLAGVGVVGHLALRFRHVLPRPPGTHATSVRGDEDAG